MQVLTAIGEVLQPFFHSIDQSFKDFLPLTKLAALFHVRPAYLALSFFILGVFALGNGLISGLFVAIFGLIYPAYMTIKTLDKGNNELNKEWLVYWIVFGFFTAFSGIIKMLFFFFLSFRAYNVFRVCFYLFLFHPSTRGAAFIYNNFLKRKLTEITEETKKVSQA